MNRAMVSSHASGVPAVVLNLGAIEHLDVPSGMCVVAQLRGAPQSALVQGQRAVVGNATDAVRAGADGVAVQLASCELSESTVVAALAKSIAHAHRLALPVLLMLNDSSWQSEETFVATVRAITELGADVVKANPGNLVQGLSGSIADMIAPVIWAGGPVNENFADMARRAAEAGFDGACVGRNLFQSEKAERCVADLDAAFVRSST